MGFSCDLLIGIPFLSCRGFDNLENLVRSTSLGSGISIFTYVYSITSVVKPFDFRILELLNTLFNYSENPVSSTDISAHFCVLGLDP